VILFHKNQRFIVALGRFGSVYLSSKFINHNIMVGAGLPRFLVGFTDVGEPAPTAIYSFFLLPSFCFLTND